MFDTPAQTNFETAHVDAHLRNGFARFGVKAAKRRVFELGESDAAGGVDRRAIALPLSITQDVGAGDSGIIVAATPSLAAKPCAVARRDAAVRRGHRRSSP